MDRDYAAFARLYALHQAGAFFITRAKSPMDARRVYSTATDRRTGVICDQRMMFNGDYSTKKCPAHLRHIRFNDPSWAKPLVFLTNNSSMPTSMIAVLYKNRWQVKLFCKWIKHFLGASENAVKTQVWCAMARYVLVAIVQNEFNLMPRSANAYRSCRSRSPRKPWLALIKLRPWFNDSCVALRS